LVKIPLPPPLITPNPVIQTLPHGTALYRLFDPASHGTTATSFRYFGPRFRFDHHRFPQNEPAEDSDRGVYYAGFTLSCCVVEVFGDTRLIECGDKRIAIVRLKREVKLLDLRGNGAMRAGSVAALGKVPDHSLSQAWSRYFYDTAEKYPTVDGLLWYNAHNDEEAIMLYERSKDALECPEGWHIRLDDRVLQGKLDHIANENGLTWEI